MDTDRLSLSYVAEIIVFFSFTLAKKIRCVIINVLHKFDRRKVGFYSLFFIGGIIPFCFHKLKKVKMPSRLWNQESILFSLRFV